MEHSIESHTRCVNELCRICGNLCCVTKKQKKNNDRAHKCALIATDMFLIYGIDVNQEEEDTYSKSICGKCFTKIRDIKRTNSNTVLTRAQEIFNIFFFTRLCPSTAGSSPPRQPSIHLCLWRLCSMWRP